jgi:hypothetical protein
MHFFRYNQLCLKCRYPYPGEGNFVSVESSLLRPLIEDVLPTAVLHDIVFSYYRRVIPEFPKIERSSPIWKTRVRGSQIREELRLMYLQDDLMSIPYAGVERVFVDKRAAVVYFSMLLDMRWFVPMECLGSPTCTRFPCACVDVQVQAQTIYALFESKDPTLNWVLHRRASASTDHLRIV